MSIKRYATLSDKTAVKGVKGRKVFTTNFDQLCTLPGCYKYIQRGEKMVRYGTYDMHVDCAAEWLESQGVESAYDTEG